MVTNPPADTLYLAEDIENYLGISRATVYTLARKGILPNRRFPPINPVPGIRRGSVPPWIAGSGEKKQRYELPFISH